MKYVTTVKDKEYIIEINDDRSVTVDGVPLAVDFVSVAGRPLYSLIVGGRSYEASVNPTDEGWGVLLQGDLYPVQVEDEREKRLRAASGASIDASGEFNLKSPMPGLVVAVPVAEGQEVQKGDILVILESMKMQNELKSPRAGKITRVKARPGETVEQHAIMVTVG
ncbi:MAG: biotin/lipoyl-binding protein [Chloroflexi bacterium]|nr:biotin/lipoyl-binding protein [Chloroflexota bacterium]